MSLVISITTVIASFDRVLPKDSNRSPLCWPLIGGGLVPFAALELLLQRLPRCNVMGYQARGVPTPRVQLVHPRDRAGLAGTKPQQVCS